MATIDAKANVCSVQFSPLSSHLLAFGSSNYRVYLYDLRAMKARGGRIKINIRRHFATAQCKRVTRWSLWGSDSFAIAEYQALPLLASY